MSFDMVMWNQNFKKAKLCYMDTDSFIVHIKQKIVKDVERRFYTSNYELGRPLPREKIKE